MIGHGAGLLFVACGWNAIFALLYHSDALRQSRVQASQ